MAMKPPDEGQPADYPYSHYWEIGFARERLAEGQHDEGHGQHAEHEEHDFDAVQTARR